MVEVKNEEQEETMREVGHLLLEVKCLARLGALASDSCIIDDELQLQDNIEYYFALRQVANLIAKIEHLLFDYTSIFVLIFYYLSVLLIKINWVHKIIETP